LTQLPVKPGRDVPMWYVLKPTDLEKVKRDLAARGSETVQRHAAEIAAIEAEVAELETLRRLALSFADKFKQPPPPPPATPIAFNVRPISLPSQAARRGQQLNNFEMFARAVAQA
jgi:hypothetical protein